MLLKKRDLKTPKDSNVFVFFFKAVCSELCLQQDPYL